MPTCSKALLSSATRILGLSVAEAHLRTRACSFKSGAPAAKASHLSFVPCTWTLSARAMAAPNDVVSGTTVLQRSRHAAAVSSSCP